MADPRVVSSDFSWVVEKAVSTACSSVDKTAEWKADLMVDSKGDSMVVVKDVHSVVQTDKKKVASMAVDSATLLAAYWVATKADKWVNWKVALMASSMVEYLDELLVDTTVELTVAL